MFTYRLYDGRAIFTLVHRSLLITGLVALSLAVTSQASAGLMHSTYDLRLTAPVRIGGNTSSEQYSGTNIAFDGAGVSGNGDPLVNTISPTPVPPFSSAASRVPRVFEPTAGGSGTSGLNADIWIKGPTTDPNNVFLNPLDTTDPNKFVELELWLKWNDLPPGQQIILDDAQLIKGVQYPAASITTSGTGSMNDPLHVVFKFRPEDVDAGAFSYVKVWFDYSPIPEPASIAQVALACVGLAGLLRRRRNG